MRRRKREESLLLRGRGRGGGGDDGVEARFHVASRVFGRGLADRLELLLGGRRAGGSVASGDLLELEEGLFLGVGFAVVEIIEITDDDGNG